MRWNGKLFSHLSKEANDTKGGFEYNSGDVVVV